MPTPFGAPPIEQPERPTKGRFASHPRAVALDVLRGLAILMMVFSGIIPFDRPLPRWMFHAQEPPTLEAGQVVHHYDPHLPGLTWVDLVFPLFLFALGASVPLALNGRQGRGAGWPRALGGMTQRLVLLGWFAIFLQHVRPYTLQDDPDGRAWLTALLGFALLFPMFTRVPRGWKPGVVWAARGVGFGGAALLLALRRYPDGTGFRLDRSDIILVVLADMAFWGTGVWLLTRRSLPARLGVLVLLLAFRLGAGPDGWVHTFWNASPVPWLFQWDYLKYLFVVVPGTIAGDCLWAWMREESPTGAVGPLALNGRRDAAFVALTLGLVVGTLAGLEARWLAGTTLLALAGGALGVGLAGRPADATGRLVRTLARWGLWWLALGLVLEPYEGGIHKDPATLSYFFVASGLALFLLAALLLVTVRFGQERRLDLLAANGQNPMVAYVAMANFFWPVFAFTRPLLDRTRLPLWLDRALPTPWLGVAYGALETLLLALFVRALTRRGILWRT